MTRFRRSGFGGLAIAWMLGVVVSAHAQEEVGQPTAWVRSAAPLETVARVTVPPVDLAVVLVEDAERDAQGLPPRYAIPNPVSIRPDTDGSWEAIGDGLRLWRLRISSAGAVSINFGFTRYCTPPSAVLFVYAADGSHVIGPFTAEDNEEHGELWTPVVLADDVVVEVTVSAVEARDLDLRLTSINVGYRGFGEPEDGGLRSGACNIDVVCPEGNAWRNEIQSVGVISTGGSTFCTGFMVNNTAQDQRPYFMTANHCEINSGNAASLVVYWNFQSPTCGQHGGGSLNQYQTGSYFRASYSASDFTLVELDSAPSPAWNVSFAGWDRSTNNPTSAVGIHHPNTDEKSISFENDPCTTTTYLGTTSPGDGTHIRVIDWDLGTTEPGSSGSPLFDQNHHVAGQLHGGYAACGNDSSDWYGRFSRSWTGGGTNSSRLSNWLDSGNTGAMSINTLAPGSAELEVAPAAGLSSSGDPGGPFTPTSIVYTLRNKGSVDLDYSVTQTQAWVSVSNPTGHLTPQATTTVEVTLNTYAESLGVGTYSGWVSFTNTTNHVGDTSRLVTLQVGIPRLIYHFGLDSNPGWTTQGQWAFGVPRGGGTHNRDPMGSHTGSTVFGYNLNGDYANNLATTDYLTTAAVNCGNRVQVELRFWRWLGVESALTSGDHASVEVSNNGMDWQTAWSHTGGIIADVSWTQVAYDLSSVADDQRTVLIRWGMGPTDGLVSYPGWNIDDVEIWAIPQDIVLGDYDKDGDVDLDDYASFAGCMTGPGGGPIAAGCDRFDFEPDADVDLDDFAAFQEAYTG